MDMKPGPEIGKQKDFHGLACVLLEVEDQYQPPFPLPFY